MLISLFLLAAFGDAEVEPPAPPPPLVLTVVVEGDRLVSRQVLPPQTMPRTIPVWTRNGPLFVEQTVTLPLLHMKIQSWDLTKAKATVDGKPLSVAEVKKRLARPAAVVLSRDGKSIDAKFLRLLARDTLVLVAPEAR